MINILVLAAGDAPYGGDDHSGSWTSLNSGSGQALATGLRSAVALLQERAERKDDEFFTRRGFLGCARLSTGTTAGSAAFA